MKRLGNAAMAGYHSHKSRSAPVASAFIVSWYVLEKYLGFRYLGLLMIFFDYWKEVGDPDGCAMINAHETRRIETLN